MKQINQLSLTKIIILTFFILSVMLGSVKVTAQEKTKQVEIYLTKAADSYNPNNIFALYPAIRTVSAKDPLRATLEALLVGPTAAEEAKGFMTSTYGMKLISVSLHQGTAYTRFTQPPDKGWPGDMAPGRFADAIERTAKQFPSVKKVVVCLDGILNFANESEDKPKPCPREPK